MSRSDKPRYNPLTCEAVQPLLRARIDGELRDGQAHEVEEHLAACGACRRLEADFVAISARVRGLLEVRPRLSSAEVARRSAERAGRGAREEALVVRSLQRLALAAAVFLVAAVGFGFLTPGGDGGSAVTLASDSVDSALEVVLNEPMLGEDL